MLAVRGATTALCDEAPEIVAATRELLLAMLDANQVPHESIVCAIFSGTPDLTAAFPAAAARELGWHSVPLFGTQELAISGAPQLCIRVMLLLDAEADCASPAHVYLRGAVALRPDLAAGQPPSTCDNTPGFSSGPFASTALYFAS